MNFSLHRSVFPLVWSPLSKRQWHWH